MTAAIWRAVRGDAYIALSQGKFDGVLPVQNPMRGRERGISLASDPETRLPGLPVTTPVTT